MTTTDPMCMLCKQPLGDAEPSAVVNAAFKQTSYVHTWCLGQAVVAGQKAIRAKAVAA